MILTFIVILDRLQELHRFEEGNAVASPPCKCYHQQESLEHQASHCLSLGKIGLWMAVTEIQYIKKLKRL